MIGWGLKASEKGLNCIIHFLKVHFNFGIGSRWRENKVTNEGKALEKSEELIKVTNDAMQNTLFS